MVYFLAIGGGILASITMVIIISCLIVAGKADDEIERRGM